MSWVLTISQITFTILTTMCTVFDIVLLLSVIKQRFFTSSTSKTPFVYITAMTLSGIIGKFADFFMVDAWPIGDLIDPVNGYESKLIENCTTKFKFHFRLPKTYRKANNFNCNVLLSYCNFLKLPDDVPPCLNIMQSSKSPTMVH